MGAESRLGVLIGHVDLNLTTSLKKIKAVCKNKTKKETEFKAGDGMMKLSAADCGVTWGVLAVVFVQFHQNWRRHHQEVPQRHGDRVRHHRKALTQTA